MTKLVRTLHEVPHKCMAVLIFIVTTAALCDNKQNLQMITTYFSYYKSERIQSIS